jgi:hypothetical protein
MRFNVIDVSGTTVGAIDVTVEVYEDDGALLDVLAEAGFIDSGEVLEVVEEEENQIDIFEYETGGHRLSLILTH